MADAVSAYRRNQRVLEASAITRNASLGLPADRDEETENAD